MKLSVQNDHLLALPHCRSSR